jgi:ubiquinone/menaquinone biosynthesis C-methylase UbiE
MNDFSRTHKKSKTMDEFWGQFLQVTFHEGKPERWTTREKKAKWCMEHLNLKADSNVLELGCGDGIVDIWLSRLKCNVTAVDRMGSVLDHARTEDDTKRVHFIQSDLQKIQFPNQSFDGIFIFETLGLQKKEEDLKLLGETYKWLNTGGRIAVDCPVSPSVKNVWEKEFPFGRVHADTSFDENTRTHKLNFNFYPKAGEPFSLKDVTCSNYDSDASISRYIYTQDELQTTLEKIGFKVQVVPHYYEQGYFGLIGIKQ